MSVVDADAYSAEMKDRQDAAWKWRNEAIVEEDEVKLARAEGAFTAFTEAKLTMDKHIISQWHRVEDGLPKSGEFGEIVIACNDVGTVNAAYLSSNGKWYAANNTMYDAWTWMPNVTHWMPLPEPPKEDA